MFAETLLAAALAYGSMPIADPLVEDACSIVAPAACTGEGTQAASGAVASGPGFDIFLSDVKWDKAGVEDVIGAYSGVAFDVDIRISDDEAVPAAGAFGFSVVCVNPDGGITRQLDAGVAADLLLWDQTVAPNTLQATAAEYANGTRYAYVEITDLCAAGERRGLLSFVSWADSPTAYQEGYEAGWEPSSTWHGFSVSVSGSWALGTGSSVTVTGRAACAAPSLALFQACHDGYSNLIVQAVSAEGGVVDGSLGFSALSGTPRWSNGGTFGPGPLTRTVTLPAGASYLRVGTDGDWRYFYPVGHPLHVAAAGIAGWSASLGVSDALDAINFVPGASKSHLLDLEGMCQDWEECQAFCDDYKSLGDVVNYFACLIDFPWDFTDVLGALRDDFMDAPAIATSRVILGNLQTAYLAIGSVPEECGSLGTLDFGAFGGDQEVSTCDIPANWRGYVRTALVVLVTIAGLVVCVNMLLRAAGFATLGEVAASASAKAAENHQEPVRKMWGPGR